MSNDTDVYTQRYVEFGQQGDLPNRISLWLREGYKYLQTQQEPTALTTFTVTEEVDIKSTIRNFTNIVGGEADILPYDVASILIGAIVDLESTFDGEKLADITDIFYNHAGLIASDPHNTKASNFPDLLDQIITLIYIAYVSFYAEPLVYEDFKHAILTPGGPSQGVTLTTALDDIQAHHDDLAAHATLFATLFTPSPIAVTPELVYNPLCYSPQNQVVLTNMSIDMGLNFTILIALSLVQFSSKTLVILSSGGSPRVITVLSDPTTPYGVIVTITDGATYIRKALQGSPKGLLFIRYLNESSVDIGYTDGATIVDLLTNTTMASFSVNTISVLTGTMKIDGNPFVHLVKTYPVVIDSDSIICDAATMLW